jgi:hypothetical protein
VSDPIDPLRAAWLLLLTMIGGVFGLALVRYGGCFAGVAAMCQGGEGLRDIGLEIVAAVMVLLAQRR